MIWWLTLLQLPKSQSKNFIFTRALVSKTIYPTPPISIYSFSRYKIYAYLDISIIQDIINVWRIQIKYTNVALTFTEISGKQYDHTFTSKVKYAMALYFMKLLFCYIWTILSKLHFLFPYRLLSHIPYTSSTEKL